MRPLVLWHCWLGGRKGIRPVKNWVVGCWHSYVAICLERSADLLMPLLLTVSCFSKSQIGFTFLVLAYPGSPGKRAIKQVCVCACACVRACVSEWVSEWVSEIQHKLMIVCWQITHQQTRVHKWRGQAPLNWCPNLCPCWRPVTVYQFIKIVSDCADLRSALLACGWLVGRLVG